jgi:prepilin-type N-terminal cleavage/methylation domain-containing protein
VAKLWESKGMTLVELMVAVGVTAVVMAVSLTIFSSQSKTYNLSKNNKESLETAQGAVEFVKRDLMQAGWSVKPLMAFYFQDGAGAGGSDIIYLNDYRIVDVNDGGCPSSTNVRLDCPAPAYCPPQCSPGCANKPNQRTLFVDDVEGCSGGQEIQPGPLTAATSSINVKRIDVNEDCTDDFVAEKYVITDSTTGANKVAQISTGGVSGTFPSCILALSNGVMGSFIAPAIRYSIASTGGVLTLNRDGDPLAENVIDMQVAYKDNNDALCNVHADQATCDAVSGCQWLDGSCTGAWYGTAGCSGSGSGLGNCSLNPFDTTQITLVRLTIIARSTNIGGTTAGEGSNTRGWDPAYCRPSAENNTAATVGSLVSSGECGYAFRTYTILFEPRNSGPWFINY